MKKEWVKIKYASPGVVAVGMAVILFLIWDMFFGFSSSAVKVLDSRITYKFTTFQDRDQYFVSCSLENTKKTKVKTTIRVQLGEESLGGRIFRSIKGQMETVTLDPLEIKAFVVQIDVPKKKNSDQRELVVHAKVKHVSRA